MEHISRLTKAISCKFKQNTFCGALWRRKGSNPKQTRYYSGNIDLDRLRAMGFTSGKVKIVCLMRFNKGKETQPDYDIKAQILKDGYKNEIPL